MAEVKWIKIATDIFDDEKMLLIESMPEPDSIIVIWFKLLCMAGKQNNSGVFMLNDKIAYTDEMLATVFRRPINTVRLALSTFEKFGMVEIVNDAITIPNWEKHQRLDALEKSREATRKRVKAFREKQKMLVTGTALENGETECNVTETFGNADREDKNKSIYNNRACARAREERETEQTENEQIEPEQTNEDYNPFGDDGPEHPNLDTLEAYANAHISNMYNPRYMERLVEHKERMPEDLIRYGIDLANKYCQSGVPPYNYVDTILRGFESKGIKSIEQAMLVEQEKEDARKARMDRRKTPEERAKEDAYEFWGPYLPKRNGANT